MKKIKVVIADDQKLFRQGLVALIGEFEEFELLLEAENGRELMEKLIQFDIVPDVALIDMDMPEMNGVVLNNLLHTKFPGIRTIILTVFNQERYINKMMEAGANSYLFKNCDTSELVHAIKTVYKSGFYFNSDTVKALRNAFKYKKVEIKDVNSVPIELTNREAEVLGLICKEYTNAEIAEQLFLSIRTVEGYRNNLLTKIGARNTAGLVIFAIKHTIFDIGFIN